MQDIVLSAAIAHVIASMIAITVDDVSRWFSTWDVQTH
jgi:hypothetical protein